MVGGGTVVSQEMETFAVGLTPSRTALFVVIETGSEAALRESVEKRGTSRSNWIVMCEDLDGVGQGTHPVKLRTLVVPIRIMPDIIPPPVSTNGRDGDIPIQHRL